MLQIVDFGATVVAATPTYALRLAQEAEQLGVDLRGSKVSRLILSGEPAGSIPQTKALIEDAWGAKAFDTAGMTEIGTIMVFECAQQPGGTHIIEDHVIEEVLDPFTLEPVGLRRARGAGRDLVRPRHDPAAALPHRRPGLPRTGVDVPCGRGFDIYEGGILGRVDDMKVIRGTNVYPRAIEAIVREFPEVDEFQTVISHEGIRDEITLRMEMKPDWPRRVVGSGERFASPPPRARARGAELPDRAGRRRRAPALRAQGQADDRSARVPGGGGQMTVDLLGSELTPAELRLLAVYEELKALCAEDLPPNAHAGVRASLALMHNVVTGLGLEYEHLSDLGCEPDADRGRRRWPRRALPLDPDAQDQARLGGHPVRAQRRERRVRVRGGVLRRDADRVRARRSRDVLADRRAVRAVDRHRHPPPRVRRSPRAVTGSRRSAGASCCTSSRSGRSSLGGERAFLDARHRRWTNWDGRI